LSALIVQGARFSGRLRRAGPGDAEPPWSADPEKMWWGGAFRVAAADPGQSGGPVRNVGAPVPWPPADARTTWLC